MLLEFSWLLLMGARRDNGLSETEALEEFGPGGMELRGRGDETF